jgi:1-acyl-sn-glycerol-3-phosphate acyltransferase
MPDLKQINSAIAYDSMLLFWRLVTNIFFREIRPRGAYNIPREGPVIFVAGPHANQVNATFPVVTVPVYS